MAGQVTFTVDANVAKAVSGILSITGAQGKVIEGFKHTKEHAGHAQEKIVDFGKELLALGGMTLGLETVKEAIAKIVEGLEHAREEAIRLNAATRGGASLPQNLGDLPAFKSKVLGLSNAFGVDAKSVVSPLLQAVGEQASNLPMAMQDEMTHKSLESFEATGADPRAAFETMLRRHQAYGDKPEEAVNRMMFLREKGGLGIQGQSELLPEILPAAQFAGISEDEMDAVIAAATKIGGSNEKTKSGLRRLFIGMSDSVGKGDMAKGDLPSMLKQIVSLRDTDPEAFTKFAGKRTEDIVSGIASRGDLVSGYMSELKGGKGNRLEEVLKTLEADPETAMAMRGERGQQAAKNLPAQATVDQQRTMDVAAMRSLGAQRMMQETFGPGFTWMAGSPGAMAVAGSGKKDDLYELGVMTAEGAKNRATPEQRNYRQLQDTVRAGMLDSGNDPFAAGQALALQNRAGREAGAGNMEGAIEALAEAAETLREGAEKQNHAHARNATTE